MCNTSSAYHVRHVVLRATWYEGTAHHQLTMSHGVKIIPSTCTNLLQFPNYRVCFPPPPPQHWSMWHIAWYTLFYGKTTAADGMKRTAKTSILILTLVWVQFPLSLFKHANQCQLSVYGCTGGTFVSLYVDNKWQMMLYIHVSFGLIEVTPLPPFICLGLFSVLRKHFFPSDK